MSVSWAPTVWFSQEATLPACIATSRLADRHCPWKLVRLSRPITRMFIAPTEELPPIVIPSPNASRSATVLWAKPATISSTAASRQLTV